MSQMSMKELLTEYNEAKESVDGVTSLMKEALEAKYDLDTDKLFEYIESKRETDFSTIDEIDLNKIISEIQGIRTVSSNISSAFAFGSFVNNAIAEGNLRESMISFKEEILNEIDSMNDMKKDLEDIEKEVKEANKNYFNYINSEEYKDKRRESIQKLRERVEDLEGLAKKDCETMISVLEECLDDSYIFSRIIDNGVVNESEVNSIVRSYFDSRASSVIMNKYRSKCNKLGINPEIYRNFFNIEENIAYKMMKNFNSKNINCLSSKYFSFEGMYKAIGEGSILVYNNLLLFHFMRLVSYCDPVKESDRLVVSQYLNLLIKITQNKYHDEQDQTNTINNLMRFWNIFSEMGLMDKFNHSNKTASSSVARIKSEHNERCEIINDYNRHATELNELISLFDNSSTHFEELDINTLDIYHVPTIVIKLALNSIILIHDKFTIYNESRNTCQKYLSLTGEKLDLEFEKYNIDVSLIEDKSVDELWEINKKFTEKYETVFASYETKETE